MAQACAHWFAALLPKAERMREVNELALDASRVRYPGYSSVWLDAATDCFATTITCSPSRRSSCVRRSAAFESAGRALGLGDPAGLGDGVELEPSGAQATSARAARAGARRVFKTSAMVGLTMVRPCRNGCW